MNLLVFKVGAKGQRQSCEYLRGRLILRWRSVRLKLLGVKITRASSQFNQAIRLWEWLRSKLFRLHHRRTIMSQSNFPASYGKVDATASHSLSQQQPNSYHRSEAAPERVLLQTRSASLRPFGPASIMPVVLYRHHADWKMF